MKPVEAGHFISPRKKRDVSLISYLWPLSAVFMFFLTGNSARLFAEEPPKKKRKDTAQITFMSTNGNSKTTTLGASHFFAYSWPHASLELSAEAFGSRSEGKVTAERYNASEKVSRKLSKQNYIFEKVKWSKNRFAGIWNRYDISGGLGRELLKLPNDSVIIELSGGYVNEERIRSPREKFASGKVYGKYTRTLSETASFLQDAEYLYNFKTPDGYRLNMSSSLLASLSTHMSIKVSYTWKYVNLPPKGFIRSDTATSVALIVNY